MSELKGHKLPSGAELKIGIAPFADGKELYQVILEEMKGLKVSANDEIDVNMFKDIFCTLLSSKKIEAAIWKCAERCLYQGHRITTDTFEPVSARQDYIESLYLIAEANIHPFGSALFVKYSPIIKGAMAAAQKQE